MNPVSLLRTVEGYAGGPHEVDNDLTHWKAWLKGPEGTPCAACVKTEFQLFDGAFCGDILNTALDKLRGYWKHLFEFLGVFLTIGGTQPNEDKCDAV